VYLVPRLKSEATEKVYDMLADSGAPCFRITDETKLYMDEIL